MIISCISVFTQDVSMMVFTIKLLFINVICCRMVIAAHQIFPPVGVSHSLVSCLVHLLYANEEGLSCPTRPLSKVSEPPPLSRQASPKTSSINFSHRQQPRFSTMATSAKRKQEETHLKMLREMTSQPPNRKCFDCDQRGPTYANMTVGSFVCTTCSGIL